MNDVDRRIGARSFARLLGEWRPPDGRGLADALADRVRLLVLDGRLPLQTRVPAERELAGALGVSRTTVAAAYDALRDAGVLLSRRGSGSWTRLPDGPAGATTQSPFSPHGDRSLYDLAHAALPAPGEELRRAAAGAVHDLDALLGGHGYDLLGLPALRTAIADRFTHRGLPTSPDQVLVTAGAQSAIGLVLAAFTAPGDRVLVEHPTYPNALDAVAARGARAVPLPMGAGPDGTGSWDLDLLAAAVRDAAPRLAYVIPEFQNPTGAVLDAAGRERLVDLTRRTGTALVVDETLAELALDGPLPPPVATFGDSAHLLTVGSASKVFWGGLRVGWIRGSASTVRRLAALRASIDLGGPALEQLVVARLLADVDAVSAARRTELTAARAHLLGRLAADFPHWRPSRPGGGLSLWVDLGEPVSSRLAVAARRHDVLLAAGPRFGLDGAFERRLRLPYTLRPERIDAALERLLLAWRGLDHVDAGATAEPVAVA
ncbi:PLP-dependent aminotransferase family protein [Pseudonocardia petroleophila]|uniref:PLP-dependent aminotransferase family protein n=1 Tax=Pseudonocardia petroleophila TaxID=37331 RepID=A0A7G7MP27_9PSEU|nr:PLP-dependent aminotransferase family protein [Pseudonocardia petroleophila]QNG54538.1 PLP-dependent aminotransferase family protein [Pseudonocardia petroleophila]